MILNQAPTPYYRFSNLAQYSHRIEHFITTRSYMNSNDFTIGMNEFRPPEVVVKNRTIVANQFDFRPEQMVFAEQIHGNYMEYIDPSKRGRGVFSKESALQNCDGMFTHHSNICLVAQAADCVPILFYDTVQNAIACAHSGWRGTIAKIGQKAVEALICNYGSNPDNIVVGVGPSIGPCCLEVGPEVAEMVEQAFGSNNKLIRRVEKYANPIFDIWAAVHQTLIESGIEPQNIEMAMMCSKCNNQILFSSRAGDRGRYGAFIMLKE